MVQLNPRTADIIAHMGEVKREVRAATEAGAARARENLAEHRDTGKSQILVEFGVTDGYVVLDDSRDLRAALSIEKGTSKTRATNVLGEAFDGLQPGDLRP